MIRIQDTSFFFFKIHSTHSAVTTCLLLLSKKIPWHEAKVRQAACDLYILDKLCNLEAKSWAFSRGLELVMKIDSHRKRANINQFSKVVYILVLPF
jgi:hypothetical protein